MASENTSKGKATPAKAPPSESTAPTAGATATRPEKPDQVAYQSAVEKARKDLEKAQEATKAASAKVSAARPGNKDSPAGKRQQELRAELGHIREKQAAFKTSRNASQDKLKALDTQLKSKIQEQKNAKAKLPFKNVEEIDAEIARLDKQVESGRMKLVDEKKALSDISAMRKQRKAFGGLDDSQKFIDELKNSITEIKKELDNPEYKALSDQYSKITQELDALKLDQDAAFKDLDSTRASANKARDFQQQKYAELKKLQDDYHSQLRAHKEYEREAARIRDSRRKQEREAYLLERRKKDAQARRDDASFPAYSEEIKECEVLLRLLDPSSVKSVAPSEPGQFAAVAQRTVESGELKGMKVMKKDDDDYFIGGGGKKGKKGKQGSRNGTPIAPAAPSSPAAAQKDFGRFFNPDVLEKFEKIGVQPPSSEDQLTESIEKVKAKRDNWIKEQPKKTQENIAAADAEIERLAARPLDEDINENSTAADVAPKREAGAIEKGAVQTEAA